MNGYVYALWCPAYKHKDNNLPLYKVGYTEKIIDLRMKKLFNTSTPEPFKCLVLFKCPDECWLETQMHKIFEPFKYYYRREFYFMELENLIKELSKHEGSFCDSEAIDRVNEIINKPICKTKHNVKRNHSSNNELMKNEVISLFKNGHNELVISQKLNISLNHIAKVIKSYKETNDVASE